MSTTQYITVSEGHTPGRVDKFLSAHLPDISRSKIKSIIESGGLTINDSTVLDASAVVKLGDVIEITPPEAAPSHLVPKKIPLNIVFEDDDIIVLNKHAGLTVHPGAGNYQDTLVNALLHHCGKTLSDVSGSDRPGIVHRLDKDTTGLMLIAKSNKAHTHLSKQIENREVHRLYHALAWGVPKPLTGSIEGNIGRNPSNRKKMSVLLTGGKHALTHYKVLEVYGQIAISLIECKLDTGRTHQIRVHLSEKGHGIVGDQVYGGRKTRKATGSLPEEAQDMIKSLGRQMLHSHTIEFTHPATKEVMSFTAPYPQDMENLKNTLKSLQKM